MKVFVAGATGAIGAPLVEALISAGHEVIGMTHTEAGARKLTERGAKAVVLSAFDEASLRKALLESEPEAVIDQLTSLPRDPADFPSAFPGDKKLRLEGGGNLHRLAEESGVRRYVQQASGFFLKQRCGLASEKSPLATDASPGIAASAQMYADIEARLHASSSAMESVALRYGFFYGPGTWYCPEGAMGEHVRRQQYPIIKGGKAVWSFVHVHDAAQATVAALKAKPGIYNVVDSDPSPTSVWLPNFARMLGAEAPPVVSESEALSVYGEDFFYYGTKLKGASNKKALKDLDFQPRPLEWLAE
jgi:2-alkyl-3-oxoalkanoate reductase